MHSLLRTWSSTRSRRFCHMRDSCCWSRRVASSSWMRSRRTNDVFSAFAVVVAGRGQVAWARFFWLRRCCNQDMHERNEGQPRAPVLFYKGWEVTWGNTWWHVWRTRSWLTRSCTNLECRSLAIDVCTFPPDVYLSLHPGWSTTRDRWGAQTLFCNPPQRVWRHPVENASGVDGGGACVLVYADWMPCLPLTRGRDGCFYKTTHPGEVGTRERARGGGLRPDQSGYFRTLQGHGDTITARVKKSGMVEASFSIMAACTRQPTRPVPVPSGRKKGKKRRGNEPQEEKTEILEEGETVPWLLTEMDKATQTDPIPYTPIERAGVWMPAPKVQIIGMRRFLVSGLKFNKHTKSP